MQQPRHQRTWSLAKIFFARLRLIGLLSLLATFVSILIFVACNAVSTYTNPIYGLFENNKGPPLPGGVFRFGMHFSVQVWLAVIGVGFGLVSYGLQEAYDHLFDAWCTGQATKRSGLDYARYLNSQPHSPILLGTRSFPVFINLRRILILLTVGASVGYKFGIRGDEDDFAVHDIRIRPANDTNLHWSWSYLGGTMGPSAPFQEENVPGIETTWLSDGLWDTKNFLEHLKDFGSVKPPQNILMAEEGLTLAPLLLSEALEETFTYYTLQHVLIANLTEGPGSFTMTRNSTGWSRVETTNKHWFTQTNESTPAVVDYRVLEPDAVQIQWARDGDWYAIDNTSDDNASEASAERLHRLVDFPDQDLAQYELASTQFGNFFDLVISINATSLRLANETLDQIQPWINALISSSHIDMFRG